MKVLVVDDTRIVLSVVEAILAQDGHEVFTARDGRDGFRVFGEVHPDMVITDIEMPWQDGLSMMQAIRRIRPDVFTLYMTGNPGPYQQHLDREAQRYAAGLLHKPFTRGELLCRVNAVVVKASPLREALRSLVVDEPAETACSDGMAPSAASMSAARFQRERWADRSAAHDGEERRYGEGPLSAGGRG